jgi:large subunit ribosomal protein L28
MARTCAVTGKSSLVGGRYSNRTRATHFNPGGKLRRKANLQKHKVYVPEMGKHVTLMLSARAMKTIGKRGAYQTLKKAGIITPLMMREAIAARKA